MRLSGNHVGLEVFAVLPLRVRLGLRGDPVPLDLDEDVVQLVSMNVKNAPTPAVLNIPCGMANCAWDFDPDRGLRVMRKR